MRAALLLGALLLRAAAWGGEACGPLTAWDGRALKLSRHAAERREQRKVSCAALKKTLARCAPFRYRHEKKVKLGCYDKTEKVFAALDGAVVLTVIAEPGEAYIKRLKRAAPKE